jgi:methyltransferase (TIGR00027 family)
VRRDRPSQTASFVALARALANDGFTTIPGFSDPVARKLLSPMWTAGYRFLSRWTQRARGEARDRAIAQLEIIPLRVAAIDDQLDKAIADGCRQLVILGAGLDTRAFRMASLADVAVFEVDHPATQSYKRRASSGLHATAKSLAFVAVDFERRALGPSLRDAGFDASKPAAWIWEGVVMYLTDEAVRNTLDDVASCSARGSVLIVHYHEPYTQAGRQARRAQDLLLSVWREPQIGLRTPDAMHAEAMRAGFDVVSDTRAGEWARRFGAKDPVGPPADVAHLLVARRAG